MDKNVEMKALLPVIKEQTKALTDSVTKAVKLLNGKNSGKAMDVKTSVDDQLAEVSKAVNLLNKSLARKYYLTTTLFDIVKAGKNVPCKSFTVTKDEDTGRFAVTVSDEKTYPTLSGLNGCGLLPSGVIDRVDMLRREVAYLESGKKAKVYLTGDVENKKDVPSKKVSELIAKEGDVSVNKAKATLAVVLKDLTGGEYKKEVFTKLYKDFARYITKRGAEWTERNMVSKGIAGDMVLEYAYMYFNDLREVKYTLG